MAAEDTREITMNANAPHVQEYATKLAGGLVERMGLGDAIAILNVALADLLVVILHQEPVEGWNNEQVEATLDNLKDVVMQHAGCAKTTTPKAKVH